ncbi:DUF3331 domain-containing protein [Paraburkholderia sp. Se-20369]|nr:DUF3331 domain-containing protein [Paraburkholderia sp. Se-20369]
MDAFNRWERVMTLLDPHLDAGHWMAPRGRDRDDVSMPSSGGPHRSSAIIAAERHTRSSVLVSWSDPTHCRYDEQRWIIARARALGHCALTGHVIRDGDAIYKPQCRGAKRPANCREMVLASAIDQFFPLLSAQIP